jgi:hypothetical protein
MVPYGEGSRKDTSKRKHRPKWIKPILVRKDVLTADAGSDGAKTTEID